MGSDGKALCDYMVYARDRLECARGRRELSGVTRNGEPETIITSYCIDGGAGRGRAGQW